MENDNRPQRDLLSIPAALSTENSTEDERSWSQRPRSLEGSRPPERSHSGQLGTHLFPTFSDTTNHVLVDKAGLDVKVLNFSAK